MLDKEDDDASRELTGENLDDPGVDNRNSRILET